MIYHDSEMMWMDVSDRDVYTGPVSKMFGQYALRAATLQDGLIRLEFNSERNIVKVPDWRGWSDMIRFDRQAGINNWIRLTTDGGKSIMATPDSIIPVYDVSKVTSGFHGETKYGYVLTKFFDVRLDDTVRVRHQINDDDVSIDFGHISSIDITKNALETQIGYEVITKSGFYNCNDVYLWSGVEVPFQPCGESSDCEANDDPAKCTGCRQSNRGG